MKPDLEEETRVQWEEEAKAQQWELPRLDRELADAKREFAPYRKRGLRKLEQLYLLGLLLDYSPNKMAEILQKPVGEITPYLSNSLYRYVEILTGRSKNTINNWRDVGDWLAEAGYKTGLSNQAKRTEPFTLPIHLELFPNESEGVGHQEEIASTRPRLYHNLRAPEHSALIGRETEITKLLELLSFDNPACRISIEGIGGAGKSTLMWEAANRCLKASRDAETTPGIPTFDAIIFISAQQQYLTSHGIFPRLQRERTLRDIFRAIADTLDCADILRANFDEQLKRIQKSLARQHSLLLLDNLETIEDIQNVHSFLCDLPQTVKVVIASRERTPTPFVPIHLESLPEAKGLQLIQQQAQEKGVNLSHKDSQELCQGTGGIPAAIVYAIGQLAAGYLLPDVLPRLILQKGDYSRFYLEGSVVPLRGQPSHQLLMALALFPKAALREAIACVAAVEDPNAIADGFARLQQLSLVNYSSGRYDMHPLTRGYASAELKANIEFEQEARERWISWYLKFSSEHGGKDWKEWNNYQQLEQEWENLQAAIDWCIDKDRYTDVQQFWRNINCYSHAHGYSSDRLTDWNTRLSWTDWLIEAAQQHEDWSMAAEAMFDRGWTLTLIGQPKHLEASEDLFARAWKLRNHKDLSFQLELAIHIAVLRFHQQKFKYATRWLNHAEDLLNQAQLEEPTAKRFLVHLLYYRGGIYYKTENHDQAKTFYQKALEHAQSLSWQRAVFLLKNWLADTAIKRGNLDEARDLLEESLYMAEQNKDKCRKAFCKRSFAFLEKAHGDFATARRWAIEAKEDFESLGMIPKAEEVQAFLQALGEDRTDEARSRAST